MWPRWRVRENMVCMYTVTNQHSASKQVIEIGIGSLLTPSPGAQDRTWHVIRNSQTSWVIVSQWAQWTWNMSNTMYICENRNTCNILINTYQQSAVYLSQYILILSISLLLCWFIELWHQFHKIEFNVFLWKPNLVSLYQLPFSLLVHTIKHTKIFMVSPVKLASNFHS